MLLVLLKINAVFLAMGKITVCNVSGVMKLHKILSSAHGGNFASFNSMFLVFWPVTV